MLSYRDVLAIGVYTFILCHLSWTAARAHQVPTEQTVLLVIERIGSTCPLFQRLEHVLGHRCNRLGDCANLAKQVFVPHCSRRLVPFGRREAAVTATR